MIRFEKNEIYFEPTSVYSGPLLKSFQFKLIQIVGAIIVSLVWLTLGTMIGFATIAIPQLRTNNRTILSSEETEIESPIIARINVSEINEEGLYLDVESESWFAAHLQS